MRLIALLALCATVAAPAGNPQPREFVQAVEFSYYLYPRTLWDRELVWLKNIGLRTVEFSIPAAWHQVRPGEYDFTGRTSPRRDLAGFIKLLRRLGLHAWIRPLPPAAGDDFAKQLTRLLATQTASHGGPIVWLEGAPLAIDAGAPPAPAKVVSAIDPAALSLSREALLAGSPALLWTNVEDRLYSVGSEPPGSAPLVEGAVGLSGDERPAAIALRRSAALLRNWGVFLPTMEPVPLPKPAAGKLPDSISATELASPAVSAVSITNRGTAPFHDDLRVFEPSSKRTLVVPGVTVPPGESLWLPLNVSLASDGPCRECSNFSTAERLVYATAELLSIEYENGILAMEFSAPVEAEAILQLEREPVGPFLAGGMPTKFDWDDRELRARLTIPASTAADHRTRIGIAIEEPETSAFINDAHRLIIGQKNTIRTSYSSAAVAARSRLRLPEGFSATPDVKSPNEIDYQVTVPADALHGDFETLAIEADGMPLGRARLQLFRPVSIRLMEAIHAHFGQHTELTPDPPIAAIDPRSGTNLEVSIRNNWPGIQTFHLDFSGDGLEFFPPKTDISIGAQDERRFNLRVFAAAGLNGLRDWTLRASGAGEATLPMRALLLPHGHTVAWSADLYGDGEMEWILESAEARAVFSTKDGGRWMEFTAKETNANFLPETGAFGATGAVTVHASGDALEFTGSGWQRTVRLAEGMLSIDQTTPLAADGLKPDKQGSITLAIERPSADHAVYTLK
jgi:hypothetical protein